MISSKPLNLRLTHINGPTLLIELEDLRILTDPTFDAAGTEYAFGPVVLKKISNPAISAGAIGPVDIVLLSHDEHADNLDHQGRLLLSKVKTVLTTSGGAERLGGNAKGLAPWSTAVFPLSGGRELTVTATPARHGPAGCEPVTGDVIGFVLTWPDEEGNLRTFYFSGDTVWFEDLLDLQSNFKIELAVLNLGNVHLEVIGPDNLTMNALEAIALIEALSIPRIVPIHIDGWTHFLEGRADVQACLSEKGLSDRALWLDPGIAVTV